MGKGSKPSTPNPYVTAAAQSQANSAAVRESATYNAVNQYSPYGSTTYQRRSDGTPESQTVTLAPQAQSVLDGQMGIANTLTGKASQLVDRIPTGPMDVSGLPSRQTSIAGGGGITASVPSQSSQMQAYNPNGLPALPGTGDFGAEAKTAQTAAYEKAKALLQPDMSTARAQLTQSLSDRGIPLDSAAGQAELNRMDRSQSESLNRAAYDAVAAGGQEQSRLFGLASTARGQLYNEGLSTAGFNNDVTANRFNQDLSAAQFGNTAQNQLFGQNAQSAQFANGQRNDALTEAMMLRNQSFNEASAMLQGTPSMQSPGFQQTPAYNVQAPDISGLVNQNYANQMNAYNQRQQGLLGTIGRLGTFFTGL